ncbi:uncharacterized protein LOC113339911 isoform X3 [Papaver somniferum]|uniref:uncharacterized protein LOC113339911 isoform X3 n=1 Tax=Papaver somniferum TaxID=3469 RepID=UPI000E6FFD71|nr:uncharacterized protein LOC113339911 isoform X3 [Papaver somniferum]
MEVLKIKHLTVPAPVISTSPIDFDAFVVNKDMVLGRIRSFPEDTACGRDGCHAQHFLDALSGPAVVVSDDVHAFIIAIVNLLLAGIQQGDPLRPLLFALALHPLEKKIVAHCSLDLQA